MKEKKRILQRIAIARKLAIVIAISGFSILTVFSIVTIVQGLNDIDKELEQNLKSAAKTLSVALKQSVYSYDIGTINGIVAAELDRNVFHSIFVWSEFEELLVGIGIKDNQPIKVEYQKEEHLKKVIEYIHYKDSINGETMLIGKLQINADAKPLYESYIGEIIKSVALQSFLILCCSGVIIYIVNHSLVTPLEKLQKGLQKVDYNAIRLPDAKDFEETLKELDLKSSFFPEMIEFSKQLQISLSEIRKDRIKLIAAKEEAEVANAAKDNFMAVISHELRTPLNPILGYIDLIREEDSEGNFSDELDAMSNAGRRLLHIIDRILQYTKIKSESVEVIEDFYDISEQLSYTQNLTRFEIERKRLTFRTELHVNDTLVDHHQSSIFVKSDQDKVFTILSNLVLNAIKYTHSGSVSVSCNIYADEKKRTGRLEFVVADTGIGITDEYLQDLFSPFSQQDNSLSRRYEGVGLGLSICKRLAEKLNGDITVKSQIEIGSEFRFWVPISHEIRTDQTEDLPPPISEKSSEKQVENIPKNSRYHFEHSHHILLVEDDTSNIEYATQIINDMGLQVDVANNGKEGVQSWKDGHYDLVLMDLSMPIMDGFQAAKLIRKEIDGDEVPIIAFTAHGNEKTFEVCMKNGMNDYICKPIKPKDLKNKLKRWLKEIPHG